MKKRNIMTIKSFGLVAATVLLLPISCAKVELDPAAQTGSPINFTVGAYVQTKNYDEPDEGGLVKELKGLGVAANALTFKTSAWLHTATEGKQDFMTAESVTYNNASPFAWQPSRDYFWPKASTSYVNFLSWYDYKAQTPTVSYTQVDTNDDSTPDTWQASISWADRTVQAKDDILYADVAWRFNGNPTSSENNTNEAAALTGTGTSFGKDGVTEGVPTLFHHALAQVLFKANVARTYEAESRLASNPDNTGTYWEVTLGTITLSSKVKKTGTLTLAQTDKGSKGIKAFTLPTNSIWTPGSVYSGSPTASDYASFTLSYASVLTTTAVAIMDGGMPDGFQAVMPQAVDDDITITMTYTIDTYYGTEAQCTGGSKATYKKTTETVTTSAIQLNDITSAPQYWQMNKKYTYTLTIDPKSSLIKFDPAVDTWTSENVTYEM